MERNYREERPAGKTKLELKDGSVRPWTTTLSAGSSVNGRYPDLGKTASYPTIHSHPYEGEAGFQKGSTLLYWH